MSILAELQWRGLLADCTDLEALTRRLAEGPTTVYAGFDPTADSLHVGNLVPLFTLRRFQLAGHHSIALAGGATGMIGDPSGTSDERNLLTPDQVAHNIAAIRSQLERFLDFKARENPARLVDNYAWTEPMTLLGFLRDVGKHFSVNGMIAKESVRARLDRAREDGTGGISYTEFSYMLLQAQDFLHLYQHSGCELQVGGTDQWGNITAGIELIRRKTGNAAWGLTFPLLTKADGTKYGKSATGTVWLDPRRTSPYRFYQFFINADDADVIKLLKVLTFLSQEEINALAADHVSNPGAREAHRALAREMTRLVHGDSALHAAVRASQILFGEEIGDTTEETFLDVVGEVPTRDLPADRRHAPLIELLVEAGLCSSKGQARKDIEGGGIYLNNVRVSDVSRSVTDADVLFHRFLLLRKGKRTYAVLRLPASN